MYVYRRHLGSGDVTFTLTHLQIAKLSIYRNSTEGDTLQAYSVFTMHMHVSRFVWLFTVRVDTTDGLRDTRNEICVDGTRYVQKFVHLFCCKRVLYSVYFIYIYFYSCFCLYHVYYDFPCWVYIFFMYYKKKIKIAMLYELLSILFFNL